MAGLATMLAGAKSDSTQTPAQKARAAQIAAERRRAQEAARAGYTTAQQERAALEAQSAQAAQEALQQRRDMAAPTPGLVLEGGGRSIRSAVEQPQPTLAQQPVQAPVQAVNPPGANAQRDMLGNAVNNFTSTNVMDRVRKRNEALRNAIDGR